MKIDPEFKSLIPALSNDERAGLESDIARDGRATVPLVVWNGMLLDGHNRYEICTKLALPFTTQAAPGWVKDRRDARIWIRTNALNRRNLGPITRAELASGNEEDFRAKARERQAATLKQNAERVAKLPEHVLLGTLACEVCGDVFSERVWHCDACGHHWTMNVDRCKNCYKTRRSAVVQNSSQRANSADALKSRTQAASLAGMSHPTYEAAKVVAAKATPELKAAVNSGVIAVSTGAELTKLSPEKQRAIAASGKKASVEAVKAIKYEAAQKRLEAKHELADKLNAAPLPAPTGPYRVIVVDPPWQYEKRAEDLTHRGRNPYPDMTTDAICNLPVAKLAEPDCILWLWTTNAFMRDAYRCLDAWGFTAKTIMTWVKDRMGTGDWLRGKTEHCILAVRGKPLVTLTNQTTALMAPLREHSRKPNEFFAMVNALCPGSKLEMFAREARPSWAAWGAEVEKFNAQ
jgi:N6-adenosine-specific RNA methylase IME4